MVCISCGRFSDALLCPICSEELRRQSYAYRYSERCPSCSRPLQDVAYPCPFCLTGFQAYGSYTGIVSNLLNQFKAGEEKLLSRVFAPLYMPMLATIEKPLLIPIPASKKGFSDRGFDQMLLICRMLTKRIGYPTLRLLVQKGEGQSKFLSLAERKERHTLTLLHLDTSVQMYKNAGYTFVLLDDICTSGSTLATGRALLAQGYGIEARSLVIAMV
ncbi:MAG: ComF family protein [Sphaerochaeta sp.]|nr:ComF family protein [Sphaerochaeta sp.]